MYFNYSVDSKATICAKQSEDFFSCLKKKKNLTMNVQSLCCTLLVQLRLQGQGQEWWVLHFFSFLVTLQFSSQIENVQILHILEHFTTKGNVHIMRDIFIIIIII